MKYEPSSSKIIFIQHFKIFLNKKLLIHNHNNNNNNNNIENNSIKNNDINLENSDSHLKGGIFKKYYNDCSFTEKALARRSASENIDKYSHNNQPYSSPSSNNNQHNLVSSSTSSTSTTSIPPTLNEQQQILPNNINDNMTIKSQSICSSRSISVYSSFGSLMLEENHNNHQKEKRLKKSHSVCDVGRKEEKSDEEFYKECQEQYYQYILQKQQLNREKIQQHKEEGQYTLNEDWFKEPEDWEINLKYLYKWKWREEMKENFKRYRKLRSKLNPTIFQGDLVLQEDDHQDSNGVLDQLPHDPVYLDQLLLNLDQIIIENEALESLTDIDIDFDENNSAATLSSIETLNQIDDIINGGSTGVNNPNNQIPQLTQHSPLHYDFIQDIIEEVNSLDEENIKRVLEDDDSIIPLETPFIKRWNSNIPIKL